MNCHATDCDSMTVAKIKGWKVQALSHYRLHRIHQYEHCKSSKEEQYSNVYHSCSPSLHVLLLGLDSSNCLLYNNLLFCQFAPPNRQAMKNILMVRRSDLFRLHF